MDSQHRPLQAPLAITSRQPATQHRPRAALLRVLLAGVSLAASGVLVGCNVSVAENLTEIEANRVIGALNESSIAASKAADLLHEGRFSVQISEPDLSHAIAILQGAGLPAEAAPGVLESMGESGLVASRKTEQARWVVGTSGELQRSLSEVNGVLSARVHLSVSEPDPLAAAEARIPASASVLIRHRGATPPLSAQDVQRLVAGAVSGLAPADVAIIFQPVSVAAPAADAALVRFGPLSVTRSSVGSLRVLVAAAAALNLILVAALLSLWARSRNLRRALPGATRAATPHEGQS